VAMLRNWSETDVLPIAGASNKPSINQLYPVLWFGKLYVYVYSNNRPLRSEKDATGLYLRILWSFF